MGAAGRGHGPGVGPAVGVEHRQRPQVVLAHRDRQVQQRADGVHGRVPVRDHHALGPGRGAAGVVDREQVALVGLRPGEVGPGRGHGGLEVQPAVLAAVERDEVPDVRQLVADAVHRVQVLPGGADHGGTGVVDDVAEIVGAQPVVDRHQHRAELRYRVERGQLGHGVRGDGGDPVTGLHAEPVQHRGPPVAQAEELLVGQLPVAVDDPDPAAVQAAGPAGELQGRQRCFQGCLHAVTTMPGCYTCVSSTAAVTTATIAALISTPVRIWWAQYQDTEPGYSRRGALPGPAGHTGPRRARPSRRRTRTARPRPPRPR